LNENFPSSVQSVFRKTCLSLLLKLIHFFTIGKIVFLLLSLFVFSGKKKQNFFFSSIELRGSIQQLEEEKIDIPSFINHLYIAIQATVKNQTSFLYSFFFFFYFSNFFKKINHYNIY